VLHPTPSSPRKELYKGSKGAVPAPWKRKQTVRPLWAAHYMDWSHSSCGGMESLSHTGDPEQEREDFLLAADQRAEESSSKH